MQADVNLKQVQRRVYISYFQDGLWDILLGFFLVGWGLMIAFDFVAIMGAVCVIFYFIVLGLKRRLTYPRAGYIKIAGARRQQMKIVILGAVLLLLGMAVFLLFSMDRRPEWLDEYFILMLGAMFAMVIALLAGWWHVTRWYIYAGLVLLAFISFQWFDTELSISFFIPGAIIAVCGFILLFRFLRLYPKEPPEDVDVSR